MPPAYTTWRATLQSHLLQLRATTAIPDMPYATPIALTLHIQQAPHLAHIPATPRRRAYSRTIPPSGDADNLAGGFMDAANGILYTDDSLVHELHVTLDRHAAHDSISFDIHPL